MRELPSSRPSLALRAAILCDRDRHTHLGSRFSMRPLWRRVWSRIIRSCTTVPTPAGWAESALLLATFAGVAVPCGLASGLLVYSPTRDSFGSLLLFAVVSLVLPSLPEEILFRAALLPHPSEKMPRRRLLLDTGVSVALFV